jgi:N utilization substance protein A
MASSADVLTAIRELANAKQLDREELKELLRDGVHAALVKKYGPTVRPEIEFDEARGVLRVAILRTVVEQVEDRVCQISLEEARWEDADFQVGDVLEEEVPFQ